MSAPAGSDINEENAVPGARTASEIVAMGDTTGV
jgi:hypothetical protein